MPYYDMVLCAELNENIDFGRNLSSMPQLYSLVKAYQDAGFGIAIDAFEVFTEDENLFNYFHFINQCH